MAYTSVLSAIDNTLGNIVLSAMGSGGAPPPHERDLTIAGNAALTIAVTKTTEPTLTVSANASCTVAGGFIFLESRSIDAVADCDALDGFRYQLTLSVGGNAAVATANGLGYTDTLTIAGNAALAVAFQHLNFQVLTIAGNAAVTLANSLGLNGTLTVSANASFVSPGGLVLFNNQAIEGFAAVTLLPGFAYAHTLTVGGIANITVSEVYLMQEALTVAGVADFDTVNQFVAAGNLTIAGIGQVTLASIMQVDNAVSFGAVGFITFENLYNILLDTVAIAGFTVDVLRLSYPTEQPAAAGSFNADCQAVLNRTVTQTLAISQQVTLQKPTQQSTHTLTFGQSVSVNKVHIETITQTLAMTQEAVGYRAIVQSLVMAQQATAIRVHNRTVSQTFTMNQTAARNTVISRTVAQTLEFYTDNDRSIPIMGAVSSGLQTQFRYTLEPAIATLVPRKCIVVLGVPGQIIVLPCPIFGDDQSEQGTVDLKRTMTGDTFTYVRKQRLQKLEYSFHVGSRKSYEMKQFLLEHSYKLITMSNWKGETWLVMITNNPVDFVNTGRWQNAGERVEFTLQFEGIKVS